MKEPSVDSSGERHASASGPGSHAADGYSSDLAYYTGLVIVWELLVLIAALWLVPWVIAAAATSGALATPVPVLPWWELGS